MHKRNLLYSFILFLIIAAGVILYSENRSVKPKQVTSKNGYVTLTLDSSFYDNYSAKKAPEGLLLLQHSHRKGITVMVAASLLSPESQALSLETLANEMKREQQALKIHHSMAIIDDELYYTLLRDEQSLSTSRLKRVGDLIIVTSIIADKSTPKEQIATLLESIEYTLPTQN